MLKTQEVLPINGKAGPTITPTKSMRKTWHGKQPVAYPVNYLPTAPI